MHDPNLEARLDFNLALYDAVCTALAAAEHIMKEAVATWLSDAWEADPNISRECHRLPWGFSRQPVPILIKTHTHRQGYRFYRYRSRVGYNPWVSKPVQYRNTGSH